MNHDILLSGDSGNTQVLKDTSGSEATPACKTKCDNNKDTVGLWDHFIWCLISHNNVWY